MSLRTKMMNLISRCIIDRSADDSAIPEIQIVGLGGGARTSEVLQPQGLYFRAPVGAEGVELAPAGQTGATVVLAAQDRGATPAGGNIADGTGGLHYLGDWKVFLDEAGVLHLGTQSGESLISRDDLVQTELARLQSELNAFKLAFDAHIHTTTATISATPTLGVISPPLAPFPPPAAPGDTACQNVKTT